MNETELWAEVRNWLRYAHEDLIAAEAMVRSDAMAPLHACFFAQQAAEKALKAVLILLQIDFPYSHNLNALRNLIPHGWQLKIEHPTLAGLTTWAVEARYPGVSRDATEAEAQSAVQEARAVGHQCLRI